MKRNRWMTASLAVMAVTAASCGSSGTKSLSADDFLAEVNTECRSTTRKLDKLDFSDKSAIGDATDIVQSLFDTLSKLKAPKALQSDFSDFTGSLDDQLTQFDKLEKAIKKGDDDAAQAASDKLDKLSKDGDDAADSLGADKCDGVTSDAGNSDTPDTTNPPDTTEPDTVDTTPDTTNPPDTTEPDTVDTTPDTHAPVTTTANTPLPIDTSVDTTPPPPDSTPTSNGLDPVDASTVFTAPAGYTWATFDYQSAETAGDDPVLGPVIEGYLVGALQSTADQSVFVNVYVTILNDGTDWTPDTLAAYYDFELGDGGGDAITTPSLGLDAQTKSTEDYTATAATGPGFGVAMFALSGADLPTLVDAFVSAQGTGMDG